MVYSCILQCTKVTEANGYPRDCDNCTGKGLQCVYPPWARSTTPVYAVPCQTTTGDQLVDNQNAPIVAGLGGDADGRPIADLLSQCSAGVYDVAQPGAQGVDVVYMGTK